MRYRIRPVSNRRWRAARRGARSREPWQKAALTRREIDARVLLCAALGIDHADLVLDPDSPLGPGATTVAAFAARRLQREPVSRIIGHRDFWRARFRIGPAVLDPRPATETLIEAVLDHAARFRRAKTGEFSTLARDPEQFYARCCRASPVRWAWAPIFRLPPARSRAAISPHWGSRGAGWSFAAIGPVPCVVLSM